MAKEINDNNSASKTTSVIANTSGNGSSSTETMKKRMYNCSFCGQLHSNYKCPTLTTLTPQQRSKLAGERKHCKNCLWPSKEYHQTNTCKSAPCGVSGCKLKHHALLHYNTNAEHHSTTVEIAKEVVKSHPSLSTLENFGLNVLLETAEVNIIVHNKPYKVRALIDQCSAVNLITEKLANRLQLKRKPSSMSINGMGNSQPNFAKGGTSIEIQSRVDLNWKLHLDCYILPQLTGNKPAQPFESASFEQFKNFRLADESFNVTGPVDIVMGVQGFLDIMGENHIKGHPSAFDTKLGYLIMGTVDPVPCDSVSTLTCDVNFDLTCFWKQEEVPDFKRLSPEEQEAEDIFTNTCKQDNSGRFTVALPFKSNRIPLGESRGQAVKRLQQMERKLEKYPEKKTLYHKAMNEYIQEGYVVEVQNTERIRAVGLLYYLPHHYVEKDSTTTKFRVVFDVSARTTTGASLNDNLLVGPCIQNDLFQTLLQFREHRIVFSADIRKMYLQIGVQESDQDYLRFLWRNSAAEPIKEFKYTVLPFGLSSSPFQAIRSLHHLAATQKRIFPLGAETLIKNFYVDDCLSGANNVKAALEKQRQLLSLLAYGQFQLRKWSSNHPALLESVPVELRKTQLPLELDATNKIKTLGLLWNPATDDFTFKAVLPTETVFTKKLVASYAAKTYDPTGLIQPVIVTAKIILQELWVSKIGWDEVVPPEIDSRWRKYFAELPDLEHFRIPRHVYPNDPEKFTIHGFCDASKLAYGAVIYVVGISTSQEISSHLLTSKSKVSPLRVITIPRLELLGAVMVTRLMKNVIKMCDTEFEEIHFWSDSSIVLNQINKPSRSFNTFVGNKVSYLQENSDQINWHYVKSKENPADLVSRGESPSALVNSKL